MPYSNLSTNHYGVKLAKCYCICLLMLLPALLQGQPAADSLHKKLGSAGIPASERINCLNALSVLYSRDSTLQAITYAHEAYQLSIQQKDKRLEAESLLKLSEGYLYNDNYDQALQYGLMALDICLEPATGADIIACYTLLGWIFYDTENASLAMQYHRLAYELLKKNGDARREAVSLNALGLVYYMKEDIDSARVFFEKSLQVSEQSGNRSAEAASLNNLAMCETALGHYKNALALFAKAMQRILPLNDNLRSAEIYNQLAEAHIKLGNYPLASSYLDSSRRFIDQSSSKARKEKLLDNLQSYAELAGLQGDYNKAFHYLKEYTTVRNEVLSNSKSEAIAALNQRWQSMKNEEQISQLSAQKELRSFQRNALAAGMLLLVVIGVLLFSRARNKRQKENELAAMRQALIKQELDNALLEKDALHNKLSYKNAELKNSALYISQRNELVREFIEELTGWQNEMQKENQGKFSRALHKFQHALDLNKEAQELNQAIEETNKDFFYNLQQQFPNLTENEKKLCAQIRLNLSIKDIASLNNISIKSAEMARYRLRKHFALNHEDSLNDFLKKF